MDPLIPRLALAATLVLPAVAAAQTGADIINKEGASQIAPAPTFPASRSLVYRIAWGVRAGPETPGGIVPGFRTAANFLFVGDTNGVPRKHVHLAVVVSGPATQSLLGRDAYRAATGVDNASIPLLQALHEAGVRIIVCGEALLHRKIDRANLLPFVLVAPTATYALATLHAQGYATWMQ